VPRGGNSKKRLCDSLSKKAAVLLEITAASFLSLHNSFGDEDGRELGRVRTNALPPRSNATKGGIFSDSSCINRSCNPNAQNTWNENLQKLRSCLQNSPSSIVYNTAFTTRQLLNLPLKSTPWSSYSPSVLLFRLKSLSYLAIWSIQALTLLISPSVSLFSYILCRHCYLKP